jgi:magnesium and cobalt exporter, CNNM family
MDTTLLITAAAILALLAVSAFFSGSETAITAVSRARMHTLEKEGSHAAHRVNRLVGDRQNVIGAILLGNTFINILVSSLATSVLAARYGDQAVAITAVALTVLILVFAEVLPKTLAIARTDRFALSVSWLLTFFVLVLSPIVRGVQSLVWRLLELFGVRREGVVPLLEPHEELRGTIELHHIEGGMGREPRDMIGGVLDLRELKIGDVAIHRKNMAAIDAGQKPQELFEALLAADHTRVPVWRETPDNIIGVLHTKAVVREFLRMRAAPSTFDILTLMEPPWFVPDTTTLEEQLHAFRERRTHFALVVDEYGALQGLVTLEDIIDEVFGDVSEWERSARPGIRPQPDGSYNIDGITPIRDINRALDWNLPDEEATTIAGLVIHEARTIPEPGQRFAFHGYKFEILRKQRNQITAIRVTPPVKAAAV